jgi:acetyltransferase
LPWLRVVSDADNNEAELAIIVRSDLQGRGVGHKLMTKTISYCRQRGTRRLVAQALAANQPMQRLAREFGFRVSRNAEDLQTVTLSLDLD